MDQEPSNIHSRALWWVLDLGWAGLRGTLLLNPYLSSESASLFLCSWIASSCPVNCLP